MGIFSSITVQVKTIAKVECGGPVTMYGCVEKDCDRVESLFLDEDDAQQYIDEQGYGGDDYRVVALSVSAETVKEVSSTPTKAKK